MQNLLAFPMVVYRHLFLFHDLQEAVLLLDPRISVLLRQTLYECDRVNVLVYNIILLDSYSCLITFCNLQIGECVAIWWRPNFETVMYPYCPPHITKPKVNSLQCTESYFILGLYLIPLCFGCFQIFVSHSLGETGVQEAFHCSFI